MKKDLCSLKGIYIAHRGLHDIKNGIPENSLIAFSKAIEKQMPIEFDLHLLKDNQIIVFHDDNLKRMTGYDKDIKDCTYEEIRNLKLLNTDQKIPLFNEVLELVNEKILMDIEFKYDRKSGLLEQEACKVLDKYNGKFIVKSFNPFSVLWFKNNKPEYIRGQLASNFKNDKMNVIKRFILEHMLFNFIIKPDFIAYDIHSITKKQANRYKRRNRLLFLWTIRTNEELDLAKEYGDSYILEKIKI